MRISAFMYKNLVFNAYVWPLAVHMHKIFDTFDPGDKVHQRTPPRHHGFLRCMPNPRYIPRFLRWSGKVSLGEDLSFSNRVNLPSRTRVGGAAAKWIFRSGHHTSPQHTSQHLTTPHFSSLQHTSRRLTSPHHTSPHHSDPHPDPYFTGPN